MNAFSLKTIKTFLWVILLGLSTAFAQTESPAVQELKQENFKQVKEKEAAIVIDVRTEEEIAAGYLPGTSVFADINAADFEKKIDLLDKDKTYIVYCRSGGRSSRAAGIMLKKGFKHVYNLNGGISNWKGEIIKK